MPQTHDLGGRPEVGPLDRAEHDRSMYEKRTDALMVLLSRKQVITVDELRRAIEGLGPQEYARLSYYECWITAIEQLLVEKGVITREEIDRKAVELEEARAW
jgi:hypothetical protein